MLPPPTTAPPVPPPAEEERREAAWRRVARILGDEIERGLIEAGARLPAEQALAARFAVNRHTARKALAVLEEAGLVRVERGRGRYVRSRLLDYPLDRRTRFSDAVRRENRASSRILLGWAEVAPPAHVARLLALGGDGLAVEVRFVSFVDDQKVSTSRQYFPLPRFVGIGESLAASASKSVTDALARHGVADYRRAATWISAVLPGEDEIAHLGVGPERPLLQTDALNHDPEGRPVEFGQTRFLADRVRLVQRSGPE